MNMALQPPLTVPVRDAEALTEVIDGVEVEKPPMSMDSAIINSRLAGRVFAFAEPRGLGEPYVETLICLSPIRDRRPDFIYVSYATWPKDAPLTEDNAWAVIPDLCVEVVSPSNTADEIEEKLDEYFEAGVKQVWIVYPRQSRVKVYTELLKNTLLGRGDTLTGGTILPGFELPLAELFRGIAAKSE